MNINEAKDIVIKAGKMLVEQGFIQRTWGNVSQRVDKNTMAITPSGRDYLSLKRDDIVLVNIGTLEYEGDVKPSSEKGVHAACYKSKDVNFVIHTHQECASVVSSLGVDSIDAAEQYTLLDEKVLCAPYGLPSTKKLVKGVEETLKKTNAGCLIMRNHGALCFGEDFEQTFDAASQLEAACNEYVENEYMRKAKKYEFSEHEFCEYALKINGAKMPEAKGEKPDIKLGANLILNDSKEAVVLSVLKKPLRPMVDDFAQIAGIKMKKVKNKESAILKALKKSDAVFVEGIGAVCQGKNEGDAEAVSMIAEKNCRAFLAAAVIGRVRPINPMESRLMRTVYKLKYSKQK